MSTNLKHFEHFGPPWNRQPVMVFAGQYDTRIETGEDYETRTLASLFTLEPSDKAKGQGGAFIPSSYHDFDGREHKAQRERGVYVALTGDVDKGDHPLSRIETLVRAFAGDAAWLIYSSAHARPESRRWRIILPLDEPVNFDTWHDAQDAFYRFMESAGIAMDWALDRAAQPVYLPNVPAKHDKTGTPLRDEQGKPLYYERNSSGTNAPGLRLDTGALAAGLAAIARQRLADDAERERIRVEAERRRANRPATSNTEIIGDFNESTSLETLFELYGYQRSPRNSDDWRSPHQQGETFATRIVGRKWISLSSSDAAAGLGDKHAAGCYGDAYDLFVHYEHQGDHKAAFRTLHAERKAGKPVAAAVRPPEPPPLLDEEYEPAGPINVPLEALAVDAAPTEPAAELPGVVNPAAWEGQSAPHRRFIIDGWLVRGSAGLLSGQEGVGKSLLVQQLLTSAAVGAPFLGLTISQVPTIYITCEDSMEELWRRQESINKALGITMQDLDGKMLLVSLHGQLGNELATFDEKGRITPTERFNQIEAQAVAFNAGLLGLDNAAHLFTGNENARHDVAAFLGLLERLSIAIDGAALLLAHPNKQHAQGNKQGNEYSGSTGWSAHVRNRLFLDWSETTEDGIPLDGDGRVLRKSKANYGKKGEEITFRWHEWAFRTTEDLGESLASRLEATARATAENDVFLRCLDKATENKVPTSASRAAANYAPRVLAQMPTAGGMKMEGLEQALNRLLHLGTIIGDHKLWQRPNRTWVVGLARKAEGQ